MGDAHPASDEVDMATASRGAESRFVSADPTERLEILHSTAEDLVQVLSEGNPAAVRRKLAELVGIGRFVMGNGLAVDELFEESLSSEP